MLTILFYVAPSSLFFDDLPEIIIDHEVSERHRFPDKCAYASSFLSDKLRYVQNGLVFPQLPELPLSQNVSSTTEALTFQSLEALGHAS